ncbi:hypothetical protein I3842_05G146000 [Carya illinoinensis]|uniref:WAT1-related protein n=1 Tax=Carya illinoinensis TaxID=32201 RepID=A0A922JQI3_CARIL|nr:hypothetical protein I3842_05G146000 [Carya illinoinensis]
MRAMLWEAVPFTVMVTMEACTIGLTIWASTAMNNGMSPFVFVFYTNSLASILLPYSFIYHRTDRTEQPLLTFSLFLRFFFLGLTGSPILVCALGLSTPSFFFMLSVLLRSTKLGWRSSSCQAKVIATLISIMGAVMVDLYKGPILILKTSLGTVKQYPELQVMRAASFYSVLGTVQSLWILFATIFVISFFTNNLHYGSVIGTIIMGIGYYAMMWGQITGDGVGEDQCAESVDSLQEKTVLLLQEEMQV